MAIPVTSDVQARAPVNPLRAHGGGLGQSQHSNSQFAVLLKCLPPWGGRTSAETDLGLGTQTGHRGFQPARLGPPTPMNYYNFVQFFKMNNSALVQPARHAARRPKA